MILIQTVARRGGGASVGRRRRAGAGGAKDNNLNARALVILQAYPQISFNLTVVHYRLNEESSCQTACDSVRGVVWEAMGAGCSFVPKTRACLSDHGELRSSSALARNLVEQHLYKKMLRGANLAEEKANSNGGACDEP